MAETLSGIVLGIGAPNRASDGREVQCAIILCDFHGLARVYSEYKKEMRSISVWDRIACDVTVNNKDSRIESWKVLEASVEGKVFRSDEKRAVLDAAVLQCEGDPIDYMNSKRRSIAVVSPLQQGIGYSMKIREFHAARSNVMAQCETPQKPYIQWVSSVGKHHESQLCEHGVYEWFRKNPSAPSRVWENLRLDDIDYTKWLVVGNTNGHRNVWVVVHVHRLKKTPQRHIQEGFPIGAGTPSDWPYLQPEDLHARRVASTGQQLLFTT